MEDNKSTATIPSAKGSKGGVQEEKAQTNPSEVAIIADNADPNPNALPEDVDHIVENLDDLADAHIDSDVSDHGSEISQDSSRGSLDLEDEDLEGDDLDNIESAEVDGDDEASENEDEGEDEDEDEEEFDEDENEEDDEDDEQEFNVEASDIEEEKVEEEEGNDELYEERKRIYLYTKHKQKKLISTYLKCIEKLQATRKKNMYLQDRICKHLAEKAKVLTECREAVRQRKEKIALQHQDELDLKISRKRDEDLFEEDSCETQSKSENVMVQENFQNERKETSRPPKEELQEERSYRKLAKKLKRENRIRKKCERKMKVKDGKGPSHTRRLEMDHYHLEPIKSKKLKEPKQKEKQKSCIPGTTRKKTVSVFNEEIDWQKQMTNNPRKSTARKSKGRKTGADEEVTLRDVLQQEKQSGNSSDDDWRVRHEKRRSKEARRSRGFEYKKSRKSTGGGRKSSGRKSTLPGTELQEEQQTDKDGRRVTANYKWSLQDPTGQRHGVDHGGNQNETNRREQEEESARKRRRKKCHEAMRKRKSILNNRLKSLLNIQENQEKREEEKPENPEDELILPEFKYEMSDVSLTKMKCGSKLRQEMEHVLVRSRFPINLEWPLVIRGFTEYFQRKNPYGKVIYSLRLQSQIKNTKKMSRKYKYIMHNYNYQIQQYNVLKEVHAKNMEYLERSKTKWDILVNDLFDRVIQEIRDYSEVAVDIYGKRLPRSQVDKSCKDIAKDFGSFQYSARIFYRVLHNVGIAIRHLEYSEQHGEGVELFEFKHLLRSNETVGAQYHHKIDTLHNYKRRCKKFFGTYHSQLVVKEIVEREVTDKFRLSGEITCMLGPKQHAVKSFEAIAKKLLRAEDGLKGNAGIVPFKNLVVDYENTFVKIGEKRQARRELQMKFNDRVREVHKIFDNMEEIQRKMPELFIEKDPITSRLDSCGKPIQFMQRPKTAPPAYLQSLQQQQTGPVSSFATSFRPMQSISTAPLVRRLSSPPKPIPEAKPTRRNSVYFSEQESRQILETQVQSRPKTAIAGRHSISGPSTHGPAILSKSMTSLPPPVQESSSTSRKPLRPASAIPIPSNSIKSRQKLSALIKESTGIAPLPNYVSSHRKSIYTQVQSVAELEPAVETRSRRLSRMIAGEEAKSIARLRQKSFEMSKPTSAKTGIVPKITRANMLALTKGEVPPKNIQKKIQQHLNRQPKRPTTAPHSKYELEEKHWPYVYYTKPSPQLEKTSKRRMDVVLGSLVHQPRPVTAYR